MKSILFIQDYVKNLSSENKELFDRIFNISSDVGRLEVPSEMYEWVKNHFKEVKKVEKQKIVRVDNKLTFESSLFNDLRASRPIDSKNKSDAYKIIKEKEGGPFCHPEKSTPKDVFGRVKGKKCVSASNIAKYDSMHGLIIFKEHNPLKVSLNDIKDYLNTAEKWIVKANKQDKNRKYPFIIWNCLWKAGASIVHGHMQIVIGKDNHYGTVENWEKISKEYHNNFGSDYFKDLYRVHKSLGLGFEYKKSKIIAHITPLKEKEIIILADNLKTAGEAVYKVVKTYKELGVESYNMGVYMPPVGESWNMPVIARFIDRGSLSTNTTDIASMELFAGTSIIESDPYKLIDKLKS